MPAETNIYSQDNLKINTSPTKKPDLSGMSLNWNAPISNTSGRITRDINGNFNLMPDINDPSSYLPAGWTNPITGQTTAASTVSSQKPTTTNVITKTQTNAAAKTPTSMEIGGWYNNPATGKNERYWGNNVWTSGAEPSPVSGGTTATSLTPEQEYRNILAKERPDFTSQVETAMGIPQEREVAKGLREQLANIPRLATAQSQQYDMNEAQRQQLISAQESQILPYYNQFMTNLSDDERVAADKIARLETNYDTQQQNTLGFLLNRIQRGETLSDAEAEQARALALKEKEYEISLRKSGSSGLDATEIAMLNALMGNTSTSNEDPYAKFTTFVAD